jgi:hypothetical protein
LCPLKREPSWGWQISAGDLIETHLGLVLGITTLCAAGFGNLISDVAGLGQSPSPRASSSVRAPTDATRHMQPLQ